MPTPPDEPERSDRVRRLEVWLGRAGPALVALLLLTVVVALGIRIARDAGRARPRGDTRFYREGARRFLAGEDLYYQHPRPRPPGYAPVSGYTYLPPFAALSVWMVPLPYSAVRAVWLLLCLACAGLALWRARDLDPRGPPSPRLTLALSVLLVLRLGWNDLAHGQVNWVVALLLAEVLRRREGALAGAALGVALAIKPTAWPLLPFFLLLGRWRLVGVCAATGGGLLAASLLRYGSGAPGQLLDWWELMQQFARDSAVSVDNASLTGLVTRLLAGSQARAGEAVTPLLLHLDRGLALGIARGVTAAVGLSLFALCVRRGRRDPGPAAAVAVVLLGALVSPVTWKAHLVVLVFPLLLLVPALLADPRPRRLAAAALLAGLLVLPGRALLDLDLIERLGSLTWVVLALLVALLRLPAPAGAEVPA